MRPPELTAPEQRVLGCLIEKRRTTPDTYPLSINALRLACNQSTNRDPVLDYDEHTVREAAQRLSHRGLARLASGAGSRAIKYRHLAEEGLGVGDKELGVLCVLLLRGPQTPGELKARTERLAHIESLTEVEELLEQLMDRGYVSRLPRRPGLKEDRFVHLLRADDDEPVTAPRPSLETPPPTAPEVDADDGPVDAVDVADDAVDILGDRVTMLEAEVTELRAEVTELRAELSALKEALGE